MTDLSDTAQQETPRWVIVDRDDMEIGAADMRERAAKLIRSMEPNGFDPRRFVDQIADAVEALPLDSAQEATDDC